MKTSLIAFLLFIFTMPTFAAGGGDGTAKQNSSNDIETLKQNVADAKENETSLQNRTIGAVGMGTIGAGGIMIGEALSEQSADEDIENEMRAYLETFTCRYGNGKSVRGGTTNVELPGGNELFNLYAQYATLANDLKIRKEALGLKPGIESEVIIDKAETGLYDDVGTGIIAGSYASVARALLVPGGADAVAWAAQKSATADKLQTGIATAAAGALTALAANAAYNGNKKKPIPEAQTLIQQLENPPLEPQKCPEYTTGETYPDCGSCKDINKRLNKNNMTCEPCEIKGQIVVDNECQCPDDKPDIDNNMCVAAPVQPTIQTCTPQCDTTKDKNLYMNPDTCKCTCRNDFQPDSAENPQSCSCPTETHEVNTQGICVKKPEPQPVSENVVQYEDTIPLSSDSTFVIGQTTLLESKQKDIEEFLSKINVNPDYTKCEITEIYGYADPKGGHKRNQQLSEDRANQVATFIAQTIKDNNLTKIFLTAKKPDTLQGRGEFGCLCIPNQLIEACSKKPENTPLSTTKHETDVEYSPCRRVDFSVTCTGPKKDN